MRTLQSGIYTQIGMAEILFFSLSSCGMDEGKQEARIQKSKARQIESSEQGNFTVTLLAMA